MQVFYKIVSIVAVFGAAPFACADTSPDSGDAFNVAITQISVPGCSEAASILGQITQIPDIPLPVDIYYPTEDTTSPGGLTLTIPVGSTTTPSLFPVPGTQSDDAAVAEGSFPLVLYSHGFGGFSGEAIQHLVALASRGYIVAAINHISSTAFDVSTLGQIITQVTTGTLNPTAADIATAVKKFRAPELECTLTALLENADGLDILDEVNPDAVAIMGFSLGGFGATDAVAGTDVDERIKAIIPLAPANFEYAPIVGGVPANVPVPMLNMYSADDTTIQPFDVFESFWDNSITVKNSYSIFFTEGEHQVFGDLCYLGDIIQGIILFLTATDPDSPLLAFLAQFAGQLSSQSSVVCSEENRATTDDIRELVIEYSILFLDTVLKGAKQCELSTTLTPSQVESSTNGLATVEKK